VIERKIEENIRNLKHLLTTESAFLNKLYLTKYMAKEICEDRERDGESHE
jgi:hypothetical protein